MKNIFINLLVRLAIKLNKVQINAHEKQVKLQNDCISEVNKLVADGKYKYVRLTDPETKKVCFTLKRV